MEVRIECYRQTEGEEFVLVKGRRLKETRLAENFFVLIHNFEDEDENTYVALDATNTSLVPFLLDIRVAVTIKEMFLGDEYRMMVSLIEPFMFKPLQSAKYQFDAGAIVEATHRRMLQTSFDPGEFEIIHLGALQITIVLSDESYRALLTVDAVDTLTGKTMTNFN